MNIQDNKDLRNGSQIPSSPPNRLLRKQSSRMSMSSLNQSSLPPFDDDEPRSCFGRFIKIFTPKPMSGHDTLTKTWWEKWRYYNRFPWKLLTHILIVVLSTTLVLLQTDQNTPYTVANVATFYKLLYPADFVPAYGLVSPGDILYVYNSHDCVNIFNNSIHNYYTFPKWSVDIFRFSLDNSTSPSPPILTVKSYKRGGYEVFNPFLSHVDTSTVTKQYYVDPTNLGPLEQHGEALREFFHSLLQMEVTLTLYSADLINSHPVPHKWRINMIYDFTQRAGRIDISLAVKKEAMPTRNVSFIEMFTFVQVALNVSIILMCSIASILSLASVKRSFILLQKAKRKLMAKSTTIKTWSEVPFKLKLRFFNVWFIFSVIADLALIIGCVFNLALNFGSESIVEELVRFFIGIGTMFSWINLMRYLEFDQKYTVLINALGRGMPNVARFILSAFPIFMGYALFGLLYFSQDTIRFASLGEAAITLFSLQNGDDIQATFRSVDAHKVVGRIYFFTFLFVSIYAVANIFISIIEDAYFSGKEASKEATNKSTNPKDALMNQETDLRNDDSLWEGILALEDDNHNRDRIYEQLGHEQDLDDTANQLSSDEESNLLSNSDFSNPFSSSLKDSFALNIKRGGLGSSRNGNGDPVAELEEEISSIIQEQQQIFMMNLEDRIHRLIAERLQGNVTDPSPSTPRRQFHTRLSSSAPSVNSQGYNNNNNNNNNSNNNNPNDSNGNIRHARQ